jgi:hypothetical protein
MRCRCSSLSCGALSRMRELRVEPPIHKVLEKMFPWEPLRKLHRTPSPVVLAPSQIYTSAPVPWMLPRVMSTCTSSVFQRGVVGGVVAGVGDAVGGVPIDAQGVGPGGPRRTQGGAGVGAVEVVEENRHQLGLSGRRRTCRSALVRALDRGLAGLGLASRLLCAQEVINGRSAVIHFVADAGCIPANDQYGYHRLRATCIDRDYRLSSRIRSPRPRSCRRGAARVPAVSCTAAVAVPAGRRGRTAWAARGPATRPRSGLDVLDQVHVAGK